MVGMSATLADDDDIREIDGEEGGWDIKVVRHRSRPRTANSGRMADGGRTRRDAGEETVFGYNCNFKNIITIILKFI